MHTDLFEADGCDNKSVVLPVLMDILEKLSYLL
jgi:hypothetical protein